MNLITLPHDKIDTKNIYFLETKKNMIIDGIFTKMIYTHSFYTMNGLYFHLPDGIKTDFFNKLEERPFLNGCGLGNSFMNIYLDLKKKTHTSWCTCIENIEKEILHDYSIFKRNNGIDQFNSQPNFLLQKQLKHGFFKTYKEHSFSTETSSSYILKMSGVWETQTEYGITYKIIKGIRVV
jgi:hypothetical protein